MILVVVLVRVGVLVGREDEGGVGVRYFEKGEDKGVPGRLLGVKGVDVFLV